MVQPRGPLGERVRRKRPDDWGISVHDRQPDRGSHLLYEMFPVDVFGLIRTIQRSLDLCLDLLPQGCNKLDIDIGLEERSGDLLECSI